MERPGLFIESLCGNRGLSQHDVASRMGRPVQAINQIIAGTKAITPQTARELAAVFPETTAEDWLRRESQYRLSQDQSGIAEAELIKRRIKIHDIAPIREMIQRKWMRATKDVGVLDAGVCQFYGVKSLQDIKPPAYCARSSAELTPVHAAWVRRATVLAEGLKQKKFSQKQLLSALPSIKSALSDPDRAPESLQLLASAGVRVVLIEHLPKTRIDGAAFWLGRGKLKPVIAISLRFGRIDYFAFTLLHEIAHILHEHQPSVDTELTAAHQELPEEEKVANRWASDNLLPIDQLGRFLVSTSNAPSKVAIMRFARELGIHPGIAVGQLQHRGIVAYSSHRDLLIDVRDQLLAQRSKLVAAGFAAFDGFGTPAEEDC